MRTRLPVILLLILVCVAALFYISTTGKTQKETTVVPAAKHWFFLHRKSNIEYFYYGTPGVREKSKLINTFTVKTGIPGERPTPLPKLVGRDYWVITKKSSSQENPETAPYFLTLNVPGWDVEPFGPTPYMECSGQCHWAFAGEFGLHGINGDETRLSKENPGSSGCIRHKDEDITYLFNLLDPENEEIRYYVEDK